MSARITISGLEHLIRLLAQHGELLALSSLAPLQHVASKAKQASATCGCNASTVYNENKGQFEVALNNLQHGDHLVMKKILNVQQICYYVRDSAGGLRLKCI